MRTTWRRVVKTEPLIFLLTVILSFTYLTDNSFGYSESDLQKLLSTKECVGCDLSGADLSGLDLREADLDKKILVLHRHISLSSNFNAEVKINFGNNPVGTVAQSRTPFLEEHFEKNPAELCIYNKKENQQQTKIK